MRVACGPMLLAMLAAGCDGDPMPRPDEACVMCDDLCVTLSGDPRNCGTCGRTCVVPNASASCVAGECGVGSCSAGFLDCNADPADGCEAPDGCAAGGSCTTACMSAGTLDCTNRCAPTCVTPAESCNGTDDDCNGACDDGAIAGCRRGVHRVLTARDHFYTIDRGEAEGAGTVEVYDFFWVYTADAGGMSPLFRCRKPDSTHLLTTDTGGEGQAIEGTIGFIYNSERCGAIPLYRVYNPGNNDHFYTTSLPERDNAIAMYGYQDQGITGWVWTGP